VSAASPEVAIVDDHQLLALSLAMALQSDGHGARVVPVARRSVESLAQDATTATVAVVDLDLGPGPDGLPRDGAELLPHLRAAGVPTVVLTGDQDLARWGECLDNGAVTVLPKHERLERLVDAVADLLRGRLVAQPAWRADAARAWKDRRAEREQLLEPLGRLTPREREVLELLAEGLTVTEIAQRDVVSVPTVRTQVRNVLAKLGVTSQLQAVALLSRARASR